MTREEAITAIKTWIGCMRKTYNDNEFAMEFVNGAETLMKEALKQPEITYCKDCKYYNNNTEYCQKYNGLYCMCDNAVKSQKQYCSYAERKDD